MQCPSQDGWRPGAVLFRRGASLQPLTHSRSVLAPGPAATSCTGRSAGGCEGKLGMVSGLRLVLGVIAPARNQEDNYDMQEL